MEGGFFVHPIQQHDCEQLCRIDSIENVEKNVNCTPEDEGVRLIYIRHVSLYIPTEVLIMCKPFEKLSEKISAFRKFIKKFSNFHVQKNLNDSATYCGERSGVKVEPLYTTKVCEFEQLVHYKRGEIVESITSDFHDIIQLTNFYENLDKNLPEDFHINETEYPNRVSNLGCDKRNISDSEDGRCKLETIIKNSTDGTVEMIDRIHCCCDESSNCDKMKRSTKAKMFCPTSKMNYIFDETRVQLMNDTNDVIFYVPIQELKMETLCFSRVIFVKDTSKNDSVSGTMTVMNGHDADKRRPGELALDMSVRTGCKVIYDINLEQISNETQMLCWENMEIQVSNNKPPNVSEQNSGAPRILFNGTLFNLLIEVTATGWKLRKEMSEVLHKCAFLYQPRYRFLSDYCYFYYDHIDNKILNVRSGNNFIFLDDFDLIFRIPDVLKKNRAGSCINMGGCEKIEGTDIPCDNIDRAVLLCVCSNEQNYCDLKLFTDVESDIKRKNVEYFEPYCNTGEFAQENGGNIKVPDNPTGSLNQFFCYEMTTITSKEVNLVTTGFFNRKAHKHYIESESKCLSFLGETSKQQCIQDGNTFFCCCKAHLRSSREHVDSRGACNKGDDVLKAYKRSLLFNTTILSNTMKERTHCDGIIENTHQRTQVSAWDMAFMPQLKCYFSIPLRPFKVDGAQINSYYYDPYNPKDDNMGIFSMLCNHKTWTKAELIGGYACRLMSTPMFKGGQDELACCSVAHLSEKNKETVNNQINKFILPNNFTRKDDRR